LVGKQNSFSSLMMLYLSGYQEINAPLKNYDEILCNDSTNYWCISDVVDMNAKVSR
jgi:hypothetical protein